MPTLLRERRRMEHQNYTVTADELPKHLKKLGVPSRAIVHFWYETPAPKKEEKKLPPHIAKMREKIAGIGGIPEDHATEFEENSKTFRDEFNI